MDPGDAAVDGDAVLGVAAVGGAAVFGGEAAVDGSVVFGLTSADEEVISGAAVVRGEAHSGVADWRVLDPGTAGLGREVVPGTLAIDGTAVLGEVFPGPYQNPGSALPRCPSVTTAGQASAPTLKMCWATGLTGR